MALALQSPNCGCRRRARSGGRGALAGTAALTPALTPALTLTLTLVLTLALTGCATPLGLQQDGTYTLESSEVSMDCQRLSNSISGALQELKSLPDAARFERAQAAPTAVAALGRLFGSDGGLVALAKYDRERAHVRALHRVLMDKGCPPLDVERALAATDAAIAEFRKP